MQTFRKVRVNAAFFGISEFWVGLWASNSGSKSSLQASRDMKSIVAGPLRTGVSEGVSHAGVV